MANSKTQVRMSSGIVNNGSQVNIWNGQCRTDIQRVEIEETPNNRSKKPNLFVERSKRFAEETSTHGVARVASAHSKLGRLFWTIVVIGAFVGLVIIIQMLMANFLRFPTNTISTIVSRNSDIFPAVTICNTNPVRTSKLKYSKYSSLVEFFENPNHRYYGECMHHLLLNTERTYRHTHT
ncbi:degenerin-like protein asic-2 [Glandiceps talaboti]